MAKNTKLTFLADENEVKIKMDIDLLIRVLVNIIQNSIKFSNSNSEIIFRFKKQDEKIIFEISDSGIGFDQKHKDELFKKFTNRGRLGTANEPSTGIGLYLCRKTVERFRGNLLAFSEGANKGSKFSVIFDFLK